MNSDTRGDNARCPVCDSPDAISLYSISPDEAAQHFMLREVDADRHNRLSHHIRTLWHGDVCTLRRCEACEFRFADPYVAGDTLFYNLAFGRSGYPSADKWDNQRTIQEIQSARLDRVLEVGSGVGHFLDQIAERVVPRAGIVATEFADDSIAKLRAKGYVAMQADVRDPSIVGPFDAIFMFQVVEHMDGIAALYERLAALLKAGGQLYISVPCMDRIEFNEGHGSLLDMPPNHIGGWSKAAFEIMGNRVGLVLEKYDIEPFELKQFVVQDLLYSHMRRAQRSGSLSNRIRAGRTGMAGRILEAAVIAAAAPSRIGVWAAASRNDLGGSQWAKFVKT